MILNSHLESIHLIILGGFAITLYAMYYYTVTIIIIVDTFLGIHVQKKMHKEV